MSTFDNFDRLAMSEAQFLRMAEADVATTSRPPLRRGPSFAEKYLWKSPSLGTSTLRNSSPSASPALSTTSSFSSPKMSGETYFGPSSMNSPSMGSGWGLGLVFRKRRGTESTASSPSIGGRTPTLGAESPKLGSSNVDAHKRSGSGSSNGSKDEFGLVKERHISQLF